MDKRVTIGILFSTTGPYAAIGRDCRDGADLALAELAADSSAPVRIQAIHADPEGDPRRYLDEARAMLRDAGCRHIVGTITSTARKEVIPLVEKHDGLLWYMCPYEGFEANENVIYVGGCPNQHLIPLFDYLLPRHGKRGPILIGANYVWGWEMNRLAREFARQGRRRGARRTLSAAGGNRGRAHRSPISSERRPSFILNNLIGPSSYAFLRADHALGDRDPAFRPEILPGRELRPDGMRARAISPPGSRPASSARPPISTVSTRPTMRRSRPALRRALMARSGASPAFFASAYTAVASLRRRHRSQPAATIRSAVRRESVHARGLRNPARSACTSMRGPTTPRCPSISAGSMPTTASTSSPRGPALAADPYLTSAAPGRPRQAEGRVMSETPNFTGWHAVILHREDDNTERLARQLGLLGISVHVQWEPLDLGRIPAQISCSSMPIRAGTICCPGAAALPRCRWSRCSVRKRRAASPGRWSRARARSSPSRSPPRRSIRRWSWRSRSIASATAVAERLQYLEERVRMRPLVHAAVEKLHGRARARRGARLCDPARLRHAPAAVRWSRSPRSSSAGREPLPEVG